MIEAGGYPANRPPRLRCLLPAATTAPSPPTPQRPINRSLSRPSSSSACTLVWLRACWQLSQLRSVRWSRLRLAGKCRAAGTLRQLRAFLHSQNWPALCADPSWEQRPRPVRRRDEEVSRARSSGSGHRIWTTASSTRATTFYRMGEPIQVQIGKLLVLGVPRQRPSGTWLAQWRHYRASHSPCKKSRYS